MARKGHHSSNNAPNDLRKESRAPGQRQRRVGELLRHALMEVLERDLLRDPDLVGRPITVTEIRTSPDLRNATAFILPLGGGDSAPIIAALGRAAPFLRRELASKVQLRYMPALHFQPDPSFDEADHIETLLRSDAVARDLASGAKPDPDPDQDGA